MGIGPFLINGFKIVVADLLLAGDNALVIAIAVRSLPQRERRIGTACGAGVAVVMRVALTFVAARLLTIEYVQLVGGLFILWIALKVLIDASEPPEAKPAPRRLAQAIWYIALADLTMSVDNILAIAGASRGHIGLIIFGLCLSIPFVVFSANLLSNLMDRHPIIIYVGAGVLGQVAGEMIVTDPFTVQLLNPSPTARYIVEGVLVVALIAAGKLISNARRRPVEV